MNKIINQSFKIDFNYDIFFTNNVFDVKNNTLINILNKNKKSKKNLILFIDKNLYNKHTDLIHNIEQYAKINKKYINIVCEPILITGGEKIKNHYSIVKCIYKLIDLYKICRQSYILAIGGGTIQDLVGFAASTAHRGVKLIRIPTTTLSQDDSGVGVKNGINFINKKNFIGCFSPPHAVINDYNFLTSLNDEIFIEGFSEAIKIAILKNKKLFTLIKNNTNKLLLRDNTVSSEIIFNCAKIHAHHISKKRDPFENTSSRPLDFGHWAAHKIESLSKYKISHGKSVATGIALDCTYSYLLKIMPKADWKEIIKVLTNLGLPIYFKELSIKIHNKYVIFNGLEEFREHLGGKLTITLITKIGKKIETHHVNKNIYIKAICMLKKINNLIKK